MANNLSDSLENSLLDLTVRGVAFTAPTTYLALFTASPGEAGSLVNEVANAGAYARQALAADFATAASAGSISNSGEILFPQATAAWGTVTDLAIVDSATQGAGTVLWYAPLDVSRTINSGDTFRIPVGNLTLTMS